MNTITGCGGDLLQILFQLTVQHTAIVPVIEHTGNIPQHGTHTSAIRRLCHRGEECPDSFFRLVLGGTAVLPDNHRHAVIQKPAFQLVHVVFQNPLISG